MLPNLTGRCACCGERAFKLAVVRMENGRVAMFRICPICDPATTAAAVELLAPAGPAAITDSGGVVAYVI